MITIRPAKERGHENHGWLDSYHTFSFADYHDPAHMSFRQLRVINEDRVAPGGGFPPHPHRDMEIISYVLDGALEHRDSTGSEYVVRRGDVQRMTAGRGVTHSEKNASKRDPVHFLQIWIMPAERGLTPGYEQKAFPEEERRGKLRLVAAPGGRDGAVSINQDVALFSAILAAGESVTHDLDPGRHAWLQVARGSVTLNGQKLAAGDGAAVSDEKRLTLVASEPAEVLLFDLA